MTDDERSKGGSRMLRHAAREEGWTAPEHGDSDWLVAIEEHFARHLAPAEWVLHELVSDLVHVDVHVVPAAGERDHHVLFTTGCSALPMTLPEGYEGTAHAELMVLLPSSWKLRQEDWEDERWYWPIRWLKILARLPHEYRTWIGWGHTIPNGHPPRPFDASTKLSGILLLPSLTHPELRSIPLPGDRVVDLWTLYPLHPDELDYKLDEGTEALLDRFDQREVSDVIDPSRPSVLR